MAETKFEVLVEGYGAAVLSIAWRILGDRHKAQDVYQEVFFEIWRRWDKYDSETNWEGYLYRATVRKAIEYTKRKVSDAVVGEIEEPVTEERPYERLMAAELRDKIMRSIGRLPRHEAEVFVMSQIEKLDKKEIARLIGCSRDTVRVYLSRAMKKMLRELDGYFPDGRR